MAKKQMTEAEKKEKEKKDLMKEIERLKKEGRPTQSIDVHLRFTEGLLGTSPSDPDIYDKWIRKNHPRKKDGGGQDEIDSISNAQEEEEEEVQSRTVFHRDDEGNPFIYDYQIKGFFKEMALALIGAEGSILEKVKDQDKLDLTNYRRKRTIDNRLFIFPRKVELHLPEGGEMTECVRSLRAETQRGERIALACSEEAPAGTEIKFRVDITKKNLLQFVLEALTFGGFKGMGGWRNSGKGRFEVLDAQESDI